MTNPQRFSWDWLLTKKWMSVSWDPQLSSMSGEPSSSAFWAATSPPFHLLCTLQWTAWSTKTVWSTFLSEDRCAILSAA